MDSITVDVDSHENQEGMKMSNSLYDQRRTGQQQAGGSESDFMGSIRKVGTLKELKIEEIAKEKGIAETAAHKFKKDLKTTQLRRFFDHIKSIEELLNQGRADEMTSKLFMLRPMAANAYGRRLIPKEFFDFIDLCIRKIADEQDKEGRKESISRFIYLLECIVAYHKYLNPKGE